LFLHYDKSDEIGLMIGALDEAEVFRPRYHYGVESRLQWADIGQGLREEITKERLA
jgi:hypothetical protein